MIPVPTPLASASMPAAGVAVGAVDLHDEMVPQTVDAARVAA
jgi:hypothetical protein